MYFNVVRLLFKLLLKIRNVLISIKNVKRMGVKHRLRIKISTISEAMADRLGELTSMQTVLEDRKENAGIRHPFFKIEFSLN